nr:MAG TPA: hypothetical protein [Caudoviricetes sp.]
MGKIKNCLIRVPVKIRRFECGFIVFRYALSPLFGDVTQRQTKTKNAPKIYPGALSVWYALLFNVRGLFRRFVGLAMCVYRFLKMALWGIYAASTL